MKIFAKQLWGDLVFFGSFLIIVMQILGWVFSIEEALVLLVTVGLAGLTGGQAYRKINQP